MNFLSCRPRLFIAKLNNLLVSFPYTSPETFLTYYSSSFPVLKLISSWAPNYVHVTLDLKVLTLSPYTRIPLDVLDCSPQILQFPLHCPR